MARSFDFGLTSTIALAATVASTTGLFLWGGGVIGDLRPMQIEITNGHLLESTRDDHWDDSSPTVSPVTCVLSV